MNSFSRYLAAVAAAIALMAGTASAKPEGAKKIVLVHRALVDGSGWRAIHDIWKQKGSRVSIVQQPYTSLEADVAATKRVLDQPSGPVVLVGQSYGGTVISVAGVDPKVKALVFVATVQPDTGESSADLTGSMSAAAASKHLKLVGGFVHLDPSKFASMVGADLPAATSSFMANSKTHASPSIFEAKVGLAAWRTKPSYGIVATDDRSISPDLQRSMYRRSGAEITELKASHAVYLSQPEAVARVIERAARRVK